jgi:hypothetical protein
MRVLTSIRYAFLRYPTEYPNSTRRRISDFFRLAITVYGIKPNFEEKKLFSMRISHVAQLLCQGGPVPEASGKRKFPTATSTHS